MQNFTAGSRKKLSKIALLNLLLILMAVAVVRIRARPHWQQKVDDWVMESTDTAEETEFLVVLQEQADLNVVDGLTAKADKGTAVYDLLTAVAQRTQPAVIAELTEAGVSYQPFWISNMIWVRGDRTLVELLAGRSDVVRIHANPWTKLDTLAMPVEARQTAEDPALDWNIELVKAPSVWAQGVTGTGAIIGGQDTGYDWQHPALMEQYRGWDGQAASHAYNWHDAIHEDNPNTAPGNPCGFDSPQPCDDQGHGTHTMGTMVGEDGPDNRIGMAPGAQWIACRNMEQGWGTPATYAECYEWFVAPYSQGGDPFSEGDPLEAPHVINNSWSCPVREGCTDPDILRNVVDNVRAAGIVTVQSAANNGPGCGSLSVPAANYEASFSVGATDSDDQIAGFSSRGPSLQDDNLLIKPDISAPGVSIRSSIPGDSYGVSSGTSMAGPHVAGLVALLIDTRPDLAGNVDRLEQLIQDTAVPQYSNEGCGNDGPDSVPNNAYGWGRIDACKAASKAGLEAYCYESFLPFLPTFVGS
jgi:subtilisin family serine protease